MHQRQAYIIDGVVSESATKARAADHFKDAGQRTRIHYHSADSAHCNARCNEWPPVPDDKSRP